MFKFAHLGAIYNGSGNNPLPIVFASGKAFPDLEYSGRG